MPSYPLLADGAAHSFATAVSITGLDLIPAGVAAMVITALGAALVTTALRRREAERAAADDEALLARAQRVDA